MTRKARKFYLLGFLTLALGWSASAAMGPKEIARVNGRVITQEDLRRALSSADGDMRSAILKDSQSRRQILANLIDQELLAQQAEKEKLDRDAEFKEALEAFRKQYLASKVVQKRVTASISDRALKSYYEKNKAKYNTDLVRAWHILLSGEKEAAEVYKLASAKGADFQALAEKRSIDPSVKKNKGDLGEFGRGRYVPEFTEVVFRAKVGDVVGPIKTAFGYHVVKIIDKKAGKTLSFEEIEPRVRADLQFELVAEYLSKLKKDAKIQINETALK